MLNSASADLGWVILDAINALTVGERIDLIHAIWDGIAAETAKPELSDEMKAELDRRLDRLEANPGQTLTWEQVKSRISGLR